MNKLAKLRLPALALSGAALLFLASCDKAPQNTLPKEVLSHSTLIKTVDGYTFRDLNKNGKLDIYEDSRQPVEARIEDLLKQMTLEEKAGMMFINGARV